MIQKCLTKSFIGIIVGVRSRISLNLFSVLVLVYSISSATPCPSCICFTYIFLLYHLWVYVCQGKVGESTFKEKAFENVWRLNHPPEFIYLSMGVIVAQNDSEVAYKAVRGYIYIT